MTKFIPVASIRDFNLSKEIMAEISRVIQTENALRGFDAESYVHIEDGIVNKCAIVVYEGNVGSAVYFYNASLEELESTIMEARGNVNYVSAYCRKVEVLTPGWSITAANFVPVARAPKVAYELQDTEQQLMKVCVGDAGSILCNVIPAAVSAVMSTEEPNSQTLSLLSMLAFLAQDTDRMFSVAALTPKWQTALMSNPNYLMNNSTVSKTVRA